MRLFPPARTGAGAGESIGWASGAELLVLAQFRPGPNGPKCSMLNRSEGRPGVLSHADRPQSRCPLCGSSGAADLANAASAAPPNAASGCIANRSPLRQHHSLSRRAGRARVYSIGDIDNEEGLAGRAHPAGPKPASAASAARTAATFTASAISPPLCIRPFQTVPAAVCGTSHEGPRGTGR
jgi:hypothetical protein